MRELMLNKRFTTVSSLFLFFFWVQLGVAEDSGLVFLDHIPLTEEGQSFWDSNADSIELQSRVGEMLLVAMEQTPKACSEQGKEQGRELGIKLVEIWASRYASKYERLEPLISNRMESVLTGMPGLPKTEGGAVGSAEQKIIVVYNLLTMDVANQDDFIKAYRAKVEQWFSGKQMANPFRIETSFEPAGSEIEPIKK